MAQRILVGLGTVALITAVAGALAPAALAENLAEGVSCSDHTCRNNSDDIYRVQIRVHCSNPGSPYEMSVWVNSHSTEEVQVGCNGRWEQDPTRLGTPSRYVPSSVTGIDYLSASVDNSGRRRPGPAPSGS
ncbi:hypothetical protein ACFROC_31295 [Nocardia tengchongensis]|uniref:hypothetical protein n=1 Tax=Nocardia tengchongensis TaxID=2055889 RepID=UPI0036C50EF5